MFPEILKLMEKTYNGKNWRLSCENYGDIQFLFTLMVDGMTVSQTLMKSLLKGESLNGENDDKLSIVANILIDKMRERLTPWEATPAPVGGLQNRSAEHEVIS